MQPWLTHASNGKGWIRHDAEAFSSSNTHLEHLHEHIAIVKTDGSSATSAAAFVSFGEALGLPVVHIAYPQVMTTQPYASAERVLWVVDNDSSHHGQASIRRLEGKYPNLRLIHLP